MVDIIDNIDPERYQKLEAVYDAAVAFLKVEDDLLIAQDNDARSKAKFLHQHSATVLDELRAAVRAVGEISSKAKKLSRTSAGGENGNTI